MTSTRERTALLISSNGIMMWTWFSIQYQIVVWFTSLSYPCWIIVNDRAYSDLACWHHVNLQAIERNATIHHQQKKGEKRNRTHDNNNNSIVGIFKVGKYWRWSVGEVGVIYPQDPTCARWLHEQWKRIQDPTEKIVRILFFSVVLLYSKIRVTS